MSESNSPKDVKQAVENNSVFSPHFFVGWDQKKYQHNQHFIRNKSKNKSDMKFFAPGSNIVSPAEGNWGSQHWNPQRSFWESHQALPSNKRAWWTPKPPAETTVEVIKGVSWERNGEGKTTLEQTDTKSRQTDTFLVLFQEFHKPKPRTQPENPWPRGEKRQGCHGDSGILLEATLLGQQEWQSSLGSVLWSRWGRAWLSTAAPENKPTPSILHS